MLGVCLGAVWPSLSRIIARILQLVRYGWHNLWHPRGKSRVEESTPLLENSNQSTGDRARTDGDLPHPSLPASPRFLGHTSDTDDSVSSPANGVDEFPMQRPRLDHSWLPKALSFCTLTGVIGWAVVSSFTTQIPASSLGLVSSTQCGSWSLRRGVDESALADDALLQSAKERRAGEYEHACYGAQSATSSEECSFFRTQAIPSTVTRTDCPFKNQSLCAGRGLQIATRFTTGRVDASVLGLNVANPPKFNRTTICVPLNMDQGFVKEIAPDKYHSDYRYEYHFGSRNDGRHTWNYTFRTAGDPFNYRVAAYSVSAYESTPYGPEHDYWNPISGLDIIYPGKDPYLTIMFISSCRIIYRGACEDHIFPATEEYPPGSSRFRNADPRARPLACIDWNEVCTHDGVCDSMEEGVEGYGIGYEFTRSAMRQSTTFKAIKARLGNALLANEKVGDYESFRLDREQWVLESRALFNTSLARMQFDALDVAIGAGHEKAPEFYEEVTPKWAQGKMCGIYKFQLPKEYANINVWALLGIPLLVLLIIGLGREAGRGPFTEDEYPLVGELLWFDVIFDSVVLSSCKAICSTARSCYRYYQRWYQRRGTRKQAPASTITPDQGLPELGGSQLLPGPGAPLTPVEQSFRASGAELD
ncbi:hypothetical protein, variant [Phialophora macrospora]|nr:hypothetical protein, variant [Phialophora macrospora]